MRIIKHSGCENCRQKCDIYLTSLEMDIALDPLPEHILYKKYETICRQNSNVAHASIILDGNAKMYIEGINHRNIILNILLPSNYIGLMPVFGTHDYPYSVVALNDCLTCRIDIALIKRMYCANQNFMMKLNRAFGSSVTTIMRKLISLNQKQLRGKVAESLLYLSGLYDSTHFMLTITRKELAELSAISEENAVRILTEFRNEGIIDISGKEINLKQIELLETISTVG